MNAMHTPARSHFQLRNILSAAVAGSLAAFVAFAPGPVVAATGDGAATKNAATKKSAAPKATRHKVIFQVSDADPKKWSLALNNAHNVQKDLGKENVDIEIVAYGPGIGMLKADSEIASRVEEDALREGVKVVACENTMTGQKLSKADMINGIGYVKAGVVELMLKQQQGWAYIRP
jgi:intracellular sulfur oxidation DsrE/DsrF family protein